MSERDALLLNYLMDDEEELNSDLTVDSQSVTYNTTISGDPLQAPSSRSVSLRLSDREHAVHEGSSSRASTDDDMVDPSTTGRL